MGRIIIALLLLISSFSISLGLAEAKETRPNTPTGDSGVAGNRCFDLAPVTSQIRVTQVVRHDQQDVVVRRFSFWLDRGLY